jgi:kinetochore protein Spc7/SPC105
MNFNNPDDVFSSSPLSGDNASPGGIDNVEAASDDEEMPAEADDSPASKDDSQSSAKLDAALRQAAAQAGTQRFDLEEDEDVSMVMAEDEVTASFKPWAQKTATPDHEADDPFSRSPPASADAEDDDDDMSMDITRAVGRIVAQPQSDSPVSDDMSMELTMPLGSIQSVAPKEATSRRKSLKRRVSLLDASQGSPAKRPTGRRASLRQRATQEDSPGSDDQTMEFTVAIGAIKSQAPPTAEPATERSPSIDGSFADETMDFTIARGSIKNTNPTAALSQDSEPEDEDLSMEFTRVVGPGIKHLSNVINTPEKMSSAETISTPQALNTTPKGSSRKSARLSIAPSSSPAKLAKATPTRSPGRPRRSLNGSTPVPGPMQHQNESFEQSPFLRSTPQSVSNPPNDVSTPTGQLRSAPLQIPDDPIAAPILNRRRSSLSTVQFSPLAATRDEPTLRSTAILTNSIKLLSTPRKQTLASPMKRGTTPKKSQTPQKVLEPKQKTPTPKKATPRKSMSPRKRVAFGEDPEVEAVADEDVADNEEEIERISLQDFLELTRIRFMDLNTTKRRHTAAPATFHDKEIEETNETLDQYVVAGACTLPEFELYQHACHEMKKYISDGRHFVRTMETNVMEENPLLFSEYLTAPPDQRNIMDNQFKNLKSSARLEARGEWYGWRSSLLQDLKTGLLGTMDGFQRDELNLANQEKLLDTVLPPLLEKHEQLGRESQQLQQRHDELNSCDREELEQAREQLTNFDAELEEKRMLVAQLQAELAEKEARIEAVKERKIECVEEIKAAERVREECRGWSTTEVMDLKGKLRSLCSLAILLTPDAARVTALEQAHGWSVTSASSDMVTMTHINDLELYFQPSAFSTGAKTPNASISLTYVGDSASPHPRPLTTSKRFFLQLIRAHLHCIPQSQTRVADLLSLVKAGWAAALAVAEGVRWLDHTYVTDEYILSDERMAISTNVVLPAVRTKVKITYEIGVSLGASGVQTEVGAKAELVYGEKYSQEKMGDFLVAFLRDNGGSQVKDEKDMAVWADAVLDLAARLRRTGVKGERV